MTKVSVVPVTPYGHTEQIVVVRDVLLNDSRGSTEIIHSSGTTHDVRGRVIKFPRKGVKNG